MFHSYYEKKVFYLKELFLSNAFSQEQIYDLLSSLKFFEKEFFKLDDRTLGILKSEVTRITSLFLSEYKIKSVFCPKKSEINFRGFSEVIKKGKIVILNMNIATYRNLSKVIAAYLKLDFQSEVLSRLAKPNTIHRTVCFISDEFHEYVSNLDADFFAQSREAKCINIVATQSYTSLLNTLQNQSAVKVIVQSLVNKLWFRTDDVFTIEDIQKQIGKEEKEKISQTISENAKETNYNFLLKRFHSYGSNLSESFNTYSMSDYIYDTNFFTQKLETFSCLCFISNGFSILPPQKIYMFNSYLSERSFYET